jgi:hypothetical protein
MKMLDDCPECGKQLKKSRSRCTCGWKVNVMKDSGIEKLCGFLLPDGNCTRIGTIAPYGSGGRWYCNRHWYEAMVTLRR